MRNFIRLATAFLLSAILSSGAFAQSSGQLAAGGIWGNPTAAKAPASGTTVGAILDRQLSCNAQGDIIFRGASLWSCLAPGTSGLPLVSGGAGANLSYAQIGFSAFLAAAIATQSQYFSGAASVLVPASQIYQAEIVVTFGSTTTFDFNTFINAAVTLTGNITTMTLSNITAGKSGTITFIQDGTGGRTTVWNSNFKFAGGTSPTLSTAASAVDVLSYTCRSATNCPASLLKDVR